MVQTLIKQGVNLETPPGDSSSRQYSGMPPDGINPFASNDRSTAAEMGHEEVESRLQTTHIADPTCPVVLSPVPMDHIAHELPVNPRKPKADTDESQEQPQPDSLERLENPEAMSPARRVGRRKLPRSRPYPRLNHDLEEMGIVSPASDPGPSTGSIFRLCDTVFTKSIPPAISSIAIDPNSAHLPPLQPPINRNILKELDLDVIIRNPQLRMF
jgi:hypothetical protein